MSSQLHKVYRTCKFKFLKLNVLRFSFQFKKVMGFPSNVKVVVRMQIQRLLNTYNAIDFQCIRRCKVKCNFFLSHILFNLNHVMRE